MLRGLAYDSRKVAPGELFVAIPGLKQDGRRFIADALGRGAAAVVFDGPDVLAGSETGRVLVPSAREALARLADAYFGHPSRALTVVGITGTNGKTTTSILVDALLRTRGGPTGLIGTIEYRIGEERLTASQTTPEALELQSLLARMVERGRGGRRHGSLVPRAGPAPRGRHRVRRRRLHQPDPGPPRLSRDARRLPPAKARLFRLLAAGAKARRTAVINADDPAAAAMVAGLDLPTLTFGLGPAAAIRPRQYRSGMDGIHMDVDTPSGSLEIASPLVGEHNVMNLLGAIGVGLALGMDRAVIADALAGVSAAPGRFERVEAGQPFLVVVDYAHTPDALERVLATARKLLTGGGRLAAVFGCGGDRDRGKRPIMGAIAARLADRAWVTSDNPRSERPEAIVAEIVAGIPDGRPRPPRRGARPARGDPRRADVGAAGRRRGDRGQGARALPDHRHRGAALRRPRRGARRARGARPS